MVSVCFLGKKGKLLGKINSLLGIVRKIFEVVVLRIGRKIFVFVEVLDVVWVFCKKKEIMKWGRKEK